MISRLPMLKTCFCLLFSVFMTSHAPAANKAVGGASGKVPQLPIVAHRGASHDFPENTLAAFKGAIAAGAHGCEFDVRATSEGQLVVLHDETLNRTTNIVTATIGRPAQRGKIVLKSKKLHEVLALDAGRWKNEKFAGEKIPMLKQTLVMFKNSECRPVIEIKEDGIERGVAAAVREAGLVDRAVIIAFSEKVVCNIRRLEPALAVGLLKGKSQGKRQDSPEDLLALARTLDVNILDLEHSLVSPGLVALLHEHGVAVWVWTVDKPARMRELLDWGVDSITTNRPDLLEKIRASTSQGN